jgi:hypothetical protein
MRNATSNRLSKGSMICELPIALMLFLLLLAFPLMDLCTIGMRLSLVYFTARSAAQEANKQKTFTAGKEKAVERAVQLASTYAGVDVAAGNVEFAVCTIPMDDRGATSRSTSVLSAINTADNVYQVEVQLTAQVEPLVRFTNLLGSIPGLTDPITVTLVGREHCEHPAGMTI